MKHQADKHRVERQFVVGDLVCLKIQPYVQSSLATRICTKLAYRYFDPYEVEAKVGSVAYKLKLPPQSKVHPVFHVSLLKKVTGSAPLMFSPLPAEFSELHTPELVLDRRVCNKGHRTTYQLLIKWHDTHTKLATWKDEDEIIWLFQISRHGDKPLLMEGGMSWCARPLQA
jgi:hypothetical protein